ncbi:glycosyltransferase [Synechococcus sp. SYN20]|uniref:glycosyltransferase n=1 Tax=Synechococcus sp. SYN20 TaxID=1050714 RepID=UPI001CA3F636|nr:glycosyltransferase [Synechococcus sp. SYN20]
MFVTWDGPQVSYLEGLFLPIFVHLQTYGLQFHVLQFTWADPKGLSRVRSACERAGIPYRSISLWRRPVGFGSLIGVLIGGRLIQKLLRSWAIDVVMPRSTLPALATLCALRTQTFPVVFDADGLPLDERVDFAGASPSGLVYRLLRDVEAEMVRISNVVLARSSKAAEILLARAGAGTAPDKFKIVRNGRDPENFAPVTAAERSFTRRELGFDDSTPVLVYAGSLGDQYCINEMLVLFAAVKRRRADSKLLILSGSPEIACAALASKKSLADATSILSVSSDDVPRYLACADLGLSLRRRSFSMEAVAPIKVGEYLLCGLPVIASKGIGDTNVLSSEIAFLLEKMDGTALERAAEWFCTTVIPVRATFVDHCRSVGLKYFSLDACKASYLSAFDRLRD